MKRRRNSVKKKSQPEKPSVAYQVGFRVYKKHEETIQKVWNEIAFFELIENVEVSTVFDFKSPEVFARFYYNSHLLAELSIEKRKKSLVFTFFDSFLTKNTQLFLQETAIPLILNNLR